jgi:hypothetical protein
MAEGLVFPGCVWRCGDGWGLVGGKSPDGGKGVGRELMNGWWGVLMLEDF